MSELLQAVGILRALSAALLAERPADGTDRLARALLAEADRLIKLAGEQKGAP